MNSNYTLNLLRSIVLNNTMSFSLILLTWVAAVLTSSFALLCIAALMTYGHPILHSILLNPAEKAEKTNSTGLNFLSSIVPRAIAAH